MKISTKGRYALRLMIDIAGNGGGEPLSIKDISSRQDISVKYLEQITSQLCKAGLLRSSRGPQGGYRLTRSPQEYLVGDILRAAEGSLAPVTCLDRPADFCSRSAHCATLDFWNGLYSVINNYIDSVTLADLMDQ